jgi:hypothetical protein
MSFIHGKNAEAWLDGTDVSEYLNNLETAADVETAETTTFKKSWKTHIAGAAAGVISAAGFYDPTMGEIRDALQTVKTITVGPGGAETVGDLVRMAAVRTTSYVESSKIGGAVAFTWAVNSDGIDFGRVLHPMNQEMATGDGSAVDDGASSADGAVVHLHLTGGTLTSLDVDIEDSSDGSIWVPLDSFTQMTTTGAQRLEIAGTVQRYVRATWTLVGTNATFGVALARR